MADTEENVLFGFLSLLYSQDPHFQGPSSKRTSLRRGDDDGTRCRLLVLKGTTGVLPLSFYTEGSQGPGGLSHSPGFHS